MLLGCRVGQGLLLSAPLVVPLPGVASAGCLAAVGIMGGTATVATPIILTAHSTAGRATTLTFFSAAVCLGMALGGALGGAALAIGDYVAVGLCSLGWMVLAVGMLARSRPCSAGPRAAVVA